MKIQLTRNQFHNLHYSHFASLISLPSKTSSHFTLLLLCEHWFSFFISRAPRKFLVEEEPRINKCAHLYKLWVSNQGKPGDKELQQLTTNYYS